MRTPTLVQATAATSLLADMESFVRAIARDEAQRILDETQLPLLSARQTPAREWMTITQAAACVGVSRTTIGRALASGALRCAGEGVRQRRINHAELERWLATRSAPDESENHHP